MNYILKEALFVIAMVLSGGAIVGAYNVLTMDTSVQPIPVVADTPVPSREIYKAVYYRSQQLDINQKEFQCLARNIFYEAGAESYKGKIAVAQITWNRVKNGRWGETFCEVIHAKHQFSWTKQRKPAPKGELWEDSIQAARDFLKGVRINDLKDSKYYHATWIDSPKWTASMEEKMVIGQHIFYAHNR